MKKTTSNNKPLFRNCPMSKYFETRLCNNCIYCEKYDECLRKKEIRKEKRRKLKIKRRLLALEYIATFAIVLAIVIKFLPQLNISTKEIQVVETTAEENTHEVIYVDGVDININFETNPQPTNETENTQEVINLLQVEETVPEKSSPEISAYGPGELYYYSLSDEDKLYLQKAVYAEARGECHEGKVAVAAVVLNRYYSKDKRFKCTSIYSVLTQAYAFASIEGITKEMLDSIPDIKIAVEEACRGWDPTRKTFENGALFFYAPNVTISEYQCKLREGIKVQKIGNHNFHIDFNENAGEA